ncbi:hypothetical protein P153DRAFT_74623 [Dothidotthia symphoricarpi CBS 119687]|uniref:Extracellular membrane protein CFEM domain-containing protein n=1 Tax=Dothidotthia symphoricarpi CBS 119687 TaxID=1392245 RepID=A0A6A6A616_9PLEO|nr:uncharacterized protein P153DRAFT_74623 [Dothidotthia symphoricarpi CBS 119687]KAF2126996.1 hypothetical protein P153DRAFT_74623 [Dothidotthia symphoricarpi CBS 119687]
MYILSFLLLATSVHAVSLASFTPRIKELPSQCDTAYRTTISGCVGDEFKAGATCSDACVQGLKTIGESVMKACEGVDVGETSIIGLFQMGSGIKALCPNNKEETTATTTKNQESVTRTLQQTSIRSQTSTRATETDTGSSTTQTEEAKPSSTLSGLLTDPDATTTFATTAIVAPTQSSSATQSSTANNQLSNTNSGGGSPFDVVAMGSSSQSRPAQVTMAVLLATAALLVVYV